MDLSASEIPGFLASVPPYDTLEETALTRLAEKLETYSYSKGDTVYQVGQMLPGLFLVLDGMVEIRDRRGGVVSVLERPGSFGERGLNRDGIAVTSAMAIAPTTLLVMPIAVYRDLVATQPGFAKFFERGSQDDRTSPNIATARIETLLTGPVISCTPDTPIREAARQMRESNISCLAVVAGAQLEGIVTTTDLSHRVVAEGLDSGLPVRVIMTPTPISLPPDALASDVLHLMHERGVGHVPIVGPGGLTGMVTQSDLTRLQAVTSAQFVSDLAKGKDVAALAGVTRQIPLLLVQLVGSGNRHEVVTRLITDIADAVTRRLIALAEATYGPPPVPYAWLACGSQGRREQTGVSDQDNCLLLDDSIRDTDLPYFEDLANFVCDGLNACGYGTSPGEMMATNPRWRQPGHVWRNFYAGWIAKSKAEALILASLMFDLRVIGGTARLFDGLQEETLALAAANNVFMAHMIGAAQAHTPPLGLIRGFATIRSGEHKHHIDMKLSGVVPVVDLARIYALQGRLTAVNTRARLEEAAPARVLGTRSASDLMDAYDLIAQARLDHQAKQVRLGNAPDNFLSPSELSDFERSHLRAACVVVKTMQAALGQSRGGIN